MENNLSGSALEWETTVMFFAKSHELQNDALPVLFNTITTLFQGLLCWTFYSKLLEAGQKPSCAGLSRKMCVMIDTCMLLY